MLSQMNNFTFFCHSVVVYRYIQPYITQAGNSHTSCDVSDEQLYILLSFCDGVYVYIQPYITQTVVILTSPMMSQMNNYTYFCHSVVVYRYIQPYITQTGNSHTSYVHLRHHRRCENYQPGWYMAVYTYTPPQNDRRMYNCSSETS